MRVHILAFDGSEMDETEDVPVEKWKQDFHYIIGPAAERVDPNDPSRIAFQADILVAVAKIVRTKDDAPIAQKEAVVGDLMHKCCFFWLTGVVDEFDEKAPSEDGFVKIFDDHIETGWLERRDPTKLN
jgi:hypothetical protein